MTNKTKKSVLLIGCGKMGQPMLRSWSHKLSDYTFTVIDHHFSKNLKNVTIFKDIKDLPKAFSADIIILATKPSGASDALNQLKDKIKDLNTTLIISVMAGKSCSQLAFLCHNENQAIVRLMPNVAASVEASSTGVYIPNNVNAQQREMVHDIAGAIGTIINLDQEEDLRTVIAIAGSAPAYVFYLAELLENFGIEKGLSKENSRKAVIELFYGAGKLLKAGEFSPKELKDSVVSPNGTTEAAVNVLKENWPYSVQNACESAINRSKELDK